MDLISPKQRLLDALAGRPVDRPPVICPGGMMNAAVVEVMAGRKHALPAAHHKAELMSGLAADVCRETGFENFGLPFCLTVEAEALGSGIDYGTLKCEPKIKAEPFASVDQFEFMPKKAIEKNYRARAVVESLGALRKSEPDVPAIGGLTGPLSAAASLVDPMAFLKELRKKKDVAHRVLDYVTGQLIDYASALVEGGVDVICIADPTATGEILGPKIFAEYAVVYLNRIIDAIHAQNVPVIVHICGNVRAIRKELARLGGDALSVDSMVNLKALKYALPGLTTMGNLSTYILEFGDEGKVIRASNGLLMQNIDILAPACGLSTSTPLANIRAFTSAVREGLATA
ncbi:MAG: methylcobamide--CoM methyltransferase [Deltaproteobacteria bacterium]|jgi:[methyl-Co(III) methanol-specific corrinoid protein]:coenzyme M methyltransferase|nr:methylcobamide--CoM methyltransferase [Deltaproteobacteria bacterium]